MDRPTTPLSVRVAQRLSLPLFARELVEQAARPRTYLVRIAYAALLFALFGVISWTLARNSPGLLGRLGQGGAILRGLVITQFFGVYLFMPALTCGVIALEKEQGSFALLLLTRLGPTTILVEKLLSRLVPMATFFLLTLPLLAFAFTLGGVQVEHIGIALWLLSITALQIGCLSLMCSAYCQYTVSALITTYLVELLIFGVPAALWNSGPVSPGSLGFFAPGIFANHIAGMGGNLFLQSLPILGSCVVLFGLSRLFVVRRAFPAGHSVVHRLRRFTAWCSPSFLKRKSIFEIIDLPDDQPLVWQESRRTPLGIGGRMLTLCLAVLLVVICLAIGSRPGPRLRESFAILMWGVWIVSALLVTVNGASLIAKERSHQTLEVLLATPLSARDIIDQKFSAIWRLIRLLWLPFLTAILFSAFLRQRQNASFGQEFWAWSYVCCSISMVAVYLPLCAWLGCWIGLRAKNQMRAIITALAVLAAWCVLTLVFVALPLGFALDWNRNAIYRYLVLVSPMSAIILNETSGLHELGAVGRGNEWLPALINAIVYLICWRLLRRGCLRDADRCLGRLNEREQPKAMSPLWTDR